MFDPFSIAVILGVAKGVNSLKNRSKPTCQLCNKPISGSSFVTPCCNTVLSPSCRSDWQRIGGSDCMFCHASKS